MKKYYMSTLTAAGFISIALPGFAQTYVYQFTAPINGYFQQGAADPNGGAQGHPPAWGGVGDIFDFGTLSETVYYNPVANTVQQVGSFTLNSTEFTGSFVDNKGANGNMIPGMVSVDYTLNKGNDTVSFNSGLQAVGSDPTLDWSIPFTETITLTTGGQEYVDTISGFIPEAYDVTSISQFCASSIVVSQGYQHFSKNIGGQYYVNFGASDGWSGNIFDGIGDSSLSDYYYVAPVTALAVPEPNALMIFLSGVLGLASLPGWRRLKFLS